MNKKSADTNMESKPVQGRLHAYITGFALSLVFTLIPYYLVVHKSLHGNTLLATIIGFAIVQLIIQLLFFLHLGRERKPRWNLVFLANTLAIIFVVVGGSIWIMSHLKHNMSELDVTNKISEDEAVYQVQGVQTGTCPGGTGTNYEVVLKNNTATPRHTSAKLCDTLTIINEDHALREIDFGEHDHHETYAGQGGQLLDQGRNMFITFTVTGTYTFHDHIQDKITGDFTVTQ
jgi:cytochrome o ubiquinol oxidase operon protein cyoD